MGSWCLKNLDLALRPGLLHTKNLVFCVKITKTKPEEGKKRGREVGNHLWQITIVSTDRKDLVTSNPVTLFKKKNDLKFNT